MPVSGLPPYDDANIFARILRGEIPSQERLRGRVGAGVPRHQPAGADACPGDPEGPLLSPSPISRATASDAEIAGFMRAVGKIAQDLGLEAPGYRLLANMGEHSGQEVPHFHVHLVRRPPARADGAAGLRAAGEGCVRAKEDPSR